MLLSILHYGRLKWSFKVEAVLFSQCHPLHSIQKWDIWMRSHLLPLTSSWMFYWAIDFLWLKPKGLVFAANSCPRTNVWESRSKCYTLCSAAGKREAERGSGPCPRSSREVTSSWAQLRSQLPRNLGQSGFELMWLAWHSQKKRLVLISKHSLPLMNPLIKLISCVFHYLKWSLE